MQETADELYESWVNGNLTHVVDKVIASQTKARAAILSALLFSAMTERERPVFLRMLKERI